MQNQINHYKSDDIDAFQSDDIEAFHEAIADGLIKSNRDLLDEYPAYSEATFEQERRRHEISLEEIFNESELRYGQDEELVRSIGFGLFLQIITSAPLTNRQRECIELKLKEQSFRAIAQTLKCSPDTAHRETVAAFKILKDRLPWSDRWWIIETLKEVFGVKMCRDAKII